MAHVRLVVVVLIVAALQSSARAEQPWATLGWPADTKSALLLRASHVVDVVGGSKILGKVASGTRVAVVAAFPASPPSKCPFWLQIEPRGFICSDVVAANQQPPFGAHLPVVAPGDAVPGDYYIVDDAGVDVYKTEADAEVGIPTGELTGRVMLRSLQTVWVESLGYYRTDKGLVPMSQVHALRPSDFAGIKLNDKTQLPITWVVASSDAARRVLDAPIARGKHRGQTVRSVERYQQVSVRGLSKGFVDIGDDVHGSEWIVASAVATASQRARPASVGDAELWIDIELAQQTLVLYRGDRAIFATLISSGKKSTSTPTGEFRVLAKAAVTAMASEAGERSHYDVSAVPWAIRFAKGVYLHGVYWHDSFGTRRSHGCVNLAPSDAKWLYDTLLPAVPDGWSELEATNDGTMIRVR
jgi:lipoprotein-anchoring transpeptidase ErfK/SrfK